MDVSSEGVSETQQLLGRARESTNANELYGITLSILQKAKLEHKIPRLVTFGQQSMGKTTLLDANMGGPIGYSSTETGTKMPVVLHLHPSKGKDNKGKDNAIKCVVQDATMGIDELPDLMKDIMLNSEITAEPLHVQIQVPNGVHAVFVDLPGIKVKDLHTRNDVCVCMCVCYTHTFTHTLTITHVHSQLPTYTHNHTQYVE